MKARFSMMIGVAALFVLSASFAPVSAQMGAEIPDPIVQTIHYGGIREKLTFAVGEPLNIRIKNVTGDKIWYVRRRPPGVDSILLEGEAIRLERLVNGDWVSAKGQYATVIDDPDNEFGPQLKMIGSDLTVLRRWTPREPGKYRVLFYYYYKPNGKLNAMFSEPFTVTPK